MQRLATAMSCGLRASATHAAFSRSAAPTVECGARSLHALATHRRAAARPASRSASARLATLSEAVDAGGAEELPDLSAAEHAFAARLHLLPPTLPAQLLLQALTHKSHLHASLPTHERLEFLGRKANALLVTEALHAKYPVAPVQVIRDAMEQYVGSRALARWSYEVGLPTVMRWRPAVAQPEDASAVAASQVGQAKVAARCVLALNGALYHQQGLAATRDFIHAHFLSRDVDINSIYAIQYPKRHLSALLARKQMPAPVSRLVAESGRESNTPVYIVGVYSGEHKLAEAAGGSIRMAEHRAAKDALRRYYMQELKGVALPSVAEESALRDEEDTLSFYVAGPIGDTPAVL